MPELKVKMYHKNDTEIVTDSFKKRVFVGETIEQYPQKIPFQLTNDKCSIIDKIIFGQEITVHFNFRGKEYKKEGEEAMFFLTLDAWKIT